MIVILWGAVCHRTIKCRVGLNVTYVLYQIVKQLHVSARYEDDHLTSYKNIMQKANTAGCVVHYIIFCLLFHRAF